MTCKKCSATLPDDGLFCPKCGARADGNKICPKCEKLIPEDSVFCAYCGTNVGETHPVQPTPNTEAVAINTAAPTPPLAPTIDNTAQEKPLETKMESAPQESDSLFGTSTTTATSNEIDKNEERYQNTTYFNGAPIEFYEAPKEIDEKTFFAEALTRLAFNKDAPADIFDSSTFENVKLQYRQYVLATGDVEMTYSATIGYDRKETYIEKVKKYQNGQTYYEDVEKTRTVTDWKPYNGIYTDTILGYAANNDNNATDADMFDYTRRCFSRATTYNKATSKAPAPKQPTNNALEEAKTIIKGIARTSCEYSLPGDHKKNFTASSIINLTKIEAHVVPQYTFDYTYKGTKYQLRSHTMKDANVTGSFPSAEKENESEIENHPLVKTFNILTFLTLIFVVVATIVFAIKLKFLFAGIGLVMFIVNRVIRSSISKSIYSMKEYQKKKALADLLRKKGIPLPKKLKEGLGL